jgi:hypothetical protein
MIRELEIIFGHHAIALGLGVAREILIFLKELGSIAARPIVDPVASVTAVVGAPHLLRAAATTATATAVLPIVDQRLRVLVLRGLENSPLLPAQLRRHRPGHPGDSLVRSKGRASDKAHAWRAPDPRRRSGEQQAIGSGMGQQLGNPRSDAEWPPFLNAM